LKIRRRPYSGPSLARGISLMYRRCKGSGSWVLKCSDGSGGYWTQAFALADDFEDSGGKVLTFFAAQDAAKKLARGEDGSGNTAPISIDASLDDYERDLEARSANDASNPTRRSAPPRWCAIYLTSCQLRAFQPHEHHDVRMRHFAPRHTPSKGP
jgi:hypothetical protein